MFLCWVFFFLLRHSLDFTLFNLGRNCFFSFLLAIYIAQSWFQSIKEIRQCEIENWFVLFFVVGNRLVFRYNFEIIWRRLITVIAATEFDYLKCANCTYDLDEMNSIFKQMTQIRIVSERVCVWHTEASELSVLMRIRSSKIIGRYAD